MTEKQKARRLWGGGFSARASKRARAEAPARPGNQDRGQPRRAAPEDLRGGQAAPSPGASDARLVTPRRDVRHAKRLAGVAAVAIALAFASLAYGVWASATSRAAQQQATAGALPTLVATTDISAGDYLSLSKVALKDVPQAFRTPTALGAEALDDGARLASKRALVDIPAGSQLCAAFATQGGAEARLAGELAADKEAVTIAVDDETGLAGHVSPYDQVRVVCAEGASSGGAFLSTLCQSARVLAVADGTSGGQAAAASVTIEVTPQEADAVREAQYAGRVSLLLVSAQKQSADAGAIQEGGDRGRHD